MVEPRAQQQCLGSRSARPIALAAGAVLVTLAMCTVPVAAQKTDVVRLRNGDEITGEIKRLDRGRLEYSTDDMGTVNIEWDEIDALSSVFTFEVELGSGTRFLGTLLEGAPPGSIIGAGCLPVFPATVTMRPYCCSSIVGMTARIIRMVPITFSARLCSQT